MEPMTLGSPIGSPSSPGATGTSSPFLPAYLMGESLPGSAMKSKTASPTKPLRHVTFDTSTTLSSPPSEFKTIGNIRLGLTIAHEKSSGGPPIKGLFDTVDETFSSPRAGRSIEPDFHEMTQNLMNIPTSAQQEEKTNKTPSSYNKTVLDTYDDTWVTVFGFSPSSMSYIVSEFTLFGNIIDRRIPDKGNWIHLRYRTSTEARTALKSNGKVFLGYVMIGVVLCRDNEVLKLSSQSKENCAVNDVDTSFLEDANQPSKICSPSTPTLQNSTYGTPSFTNSPNFYQATPVRISNIRPLNQSYRTAQTVNEVQGDNTTPQKSNSMVTKAMEYVFGW